MRDLQNFLSEYGNNSYMYVEFPHKKHWENKLESGNSITDFIGQSILENKEDNFLYYLHIPHCHTQCLYCTCHVEITKDYDVVQKYLEKMLYEIDLQIDIFKKIKCFPKITHLHFGGGSPTFLKPPEFDALVKKLSNFINFEKLVECAIEIDPRRIREERMHYYHSIGINRISFGVQEFDLEVQKLVNRVQPEKLLDRLLTREIRDLFPNGINFDLICGLPGQKLDRFKNTVQKTIDYNPDRICLNYMHMSPKYHPHQLRMPSETIPNENERKELFYLAEEMLVNNNYIRAGYDHFVKNDDYLAKELKEKKAGWDRLGIVSGQYHNILGAGVSTTCKLKGKVYYQNTFENDDYIKFLEKKELPISSFHISSVEDQIREEVIINIRQFFSINKTYLNKKYNINFDDYFKVDLINLNEFFRAKLIVNDEKELRLTSLGKQISNLVASKFDNYIN